MAAGAVDLRWQEGMPKEHPTIHVGIDVSKDKLAVSIAVGWVRDEVLSLGTFEKNPAGIDRLLKELSRRGAPVSVQDRRDMAFIGRCVRSVSNAV